MTDHREVPVKVNAWVDEGIADLVSALSEINGLVTLESCQGDTGGRPAFVIFQYGGWRDAGELLYDKLLPALSADLRSDVSLDLRAYDTEIAHGTISISPGAIPKVAAILRELLPVSRGIAMTGHAHRKTVSKIVIATSGD
jgi:hypothetical protein